MSDWSVNEEGILDTLSTRYLDITYVHSYFTYLYTFSTSDASSGFWKLCLTEDSSRWRLKLVENSHGTAYLQASRNKGINTAVLG